MLNKAVFRQFLLTVSSTKPNFVQKLYSVVQKSKPPSFRQTASNIDQLEQTFTGTLEQ